MFKSLNDKEFCGKLNFILSENISKKTDIETELSIYFGKSFSNIKQRYKRNARTTIFAKHEEIRLNYAKEHLLTKSCMEVMLDLMNRILRNGSGNIQI
jgi:hypothetical protein